MDNPFGMNDKEVEEFFENIRFFSFMEHAMDNVEEYVCEDLIELIYHHYPILSTETRPKIIEAIEEIPKLLGFRVMMSLYNLVKDHNNGVNVREKYPKFESWKEFYLKEKTVELVDPEINPYPFMPDDMWREDVERENHDAIEYFYWENLRIAEFVNVVQEWTLDAYEEVYDLNPDEWVIYSMIFRDEYEDFKDQCEEIELFIDSGFPEEDFECFMEKFEALTLEQRLAVHHIHSERLDKQMQEMENLEAFGSLKIKSYKEYLETLTLW